MSSHTSWMVLLVPDVSLGVLLVTPILAVLSDLGLIGVCHRYTDRVHCALLLNIAAQILVLDLSKICVSPAPILSNSSRMFQS